jgi:hypothetical protein
MIGQAADADADVVFVSETTRYVERSLRAAMTAATLRSVATQAGTCSVGTRFPHCRQAGNPCLT